ncbi:PPOX class F420-dependent oxidoreductase [Actinomadura rayongensis]|uniref:PPOX class F420-dependent oxidoreductase n=1 Tax=Actinomadura rayongensis TaxID=1429076 RepID=A0A6I4W6Q8_9ACTN|nr:PPOX class F420-dependent oxidoreductase [Actinomadura rayongensis]MXQ64973.1 PPOX class F420-dependent oxidoreductase [Actinomadura rayongensis]
MTFTEPELAYLRSQRLGRLATVAPGGDPQNNPVGFRVDPETGAIDIHGFQMGASRKFRNVLRNPQVAFVVDDIVSLDPWKVRGIEIRGTAETLTDQPVAMAHMSPEIIRIHPRLVFSWGVDPSAEGMTRRELS